MQTIALEIADTTHGVNLRRAYSLPVTIGRGTTAQIQLTAENRAISRVHLEFVDERGRLVAYNRASNAEATVFNGKTLTPGERVEVATGDTIRIFETSITLLAPATLGILFAHSSDLKIETKEPLLPGTGVLATQGAQGPKVEVVADIGQIGADRLGTGLAALFYYDGSEPTFAILANPAGTQILLDKEIVAQPALYLQPNDTIEAGDLRFEVVSAGAPSIVCENADCRVLNACDSGEGCRRCGAQLFGSTRLLRVRNL